MNKYLRTVLFSFAILAASVEVHAQCAHTVDLGPDTIVCDTVLILDAGNPGMMYSWNTSEASQQVAVNTNGTYIVTVTDSAACAVSDTIDVVLYPPVVVGTVSQLGGNVLVCGNSAGVTMYSTGHSGYVMWFALDTVSGMWGAIGAGDTLSFGPLPNIAGDTFFFMTVVISGSCPEDTSNILAVPYSPSPEPDLGPDVSLCGGFLILDAGYPGDQHLWNTGDTTQTLLVGASGNYHITVTNAAGCAGEDSVDVTIFTPPVAYFPVLVSTVCVTDQPWLLTGYPTGGTFSGTGVSGNTFDPVIAGVGTFTLEYMYTDSNGCQDTATASFVVDPCVGVHETFTEQQSVFPNPAAENIFIPLNQSERSVEIINVEGRVVKMVHNLNGGSEIMVHVSELPDGIYLVRITSQNGGFRYLRFTKNDHN